MSSVILARTSMDDLERIIVRHCGAQLSKRELFAAMAMQGFARSSEANNYATQEEVLLATRYAAKCAVQWADALIAELAKATP